MRLLALEPVAGHGVVGLPEGEIVLVAEGESLPGTGTVVEEVLEDRLVLREEPSGDPPRSRLIWMFQAESGGGDSRFQVFDPVPPAEAPVLKPQDEGSGEEVRASEEG